MKLFSWLLHNDRTVMEGAEAQDAPSKVEEQAPSLGKPVYYEVWGNLEKTNRVLWIAVWIGATVAVLTLFLLRLLIQRPPVVISVNGAGQAQVADTSGRIPVSEAEVKNFLALFEKFYTELDCYTFDDSLRLAFSMMTPDFQPKADDFLKRSGIVEELKAAQGRVKLYLGELRVVRDTADVYECIITGSREISSYKENSASKEIVFEHDVVLRKVPRSEKTPYGILVEDFHEKVYKNR